VLSHFTENCCYCAGFNAAGIVLEDYYRLERLELETEGILRLEVVSTDPAVYPITTFFLPNEERYVADSHIITVKVKDGLLQRLWPPCVADADIIFLPCGFFLLSFYLFFSSPNLSRRRLDVYRTSTHGVAL